MDQKIKLGSIPTAYVCPKNGDSYFLLGIVEYKGPNIQVRGRKQIGHYTAIAKRHIIFYASNY